MGDWITNLVASALIRLALLMPYERRVPFFGWVIARLIAPLAGYTRRAETQLALIWPDMPPDRRRAIAQACCDNFGRTLIENYSRAGFRARVEHGTLSGEGLAALERARADKRPVLFVTGHFGNFEAPRQALTNRGYLIGGFYRPMSNALFNEHYQGTMTDMSGPVFAQGRKGLAGFVRFLRGGGMATILYDVRASAYPDFDFLGLPAPTSTSAAEMALKYDALLLPYFGTRRENGLDFDMEIEAPIPHSDPATMTREMNARLEAHVRAHPEQWFWVHRRWKKRARRANQTQSPKEFP